MLSSFTTDEIYQDMKVKKSDIKRTHDSLISILIDCLSEAEIDEVNATIPADLYHLLSDKCLDYVRLIEFTTE